MPVEHAHWEHAIRAAYDQFRASDTPSMHQAADALLRLYPALEPNTPPPPPPPPSVDAYREAGHAVMAYFIRYGFADRYVPLDPSDCLPPDTGVTLEAPRTDWRQTTGNLGSLVTVAQVQLGGVVAERACYRRAGLLPPTFTPLLVNAKCLLLGYVEEYSDGNEHAYNAAATAYLDTLEAYVEDTLTTWWAAVEAVAQALLQSPSLAAPLVARLIDVHISDDAKQRARARREHVRARWQRW